MFRTWLSHAMKRATQRSQWSCRPAARKRLRATLRKVSMTMAAVSMVCLCTLPVPRVHADGVLLVTSLFNSRVLRYDATTGAFLDVFIPSGSGGLGRPDLGIFLGPDGNLFVDSMGTNAVLRYNSVTGAATPSPGNGGALFVAPGSGGLRSPEGLAFGSNGNLFVAANTLPALPGSIKEYDGRTGTYLRNFVSPGSGGLSQANDIHFGPDGNLYVSSLDNRVLRYDAATGAPLPAPGRTDANFITAGSGGLLLANGFAFGPDGNLYVANDPSLSGPGSILRYSGTTGDFLDVFVTAGSGGIGFIDGIAFGPDGNLYVTDFNGNRIMRFNGMTGAFAGVFASGGGMDGAAGLAFAPPVPEPGSLALLGLGALGLLAYSWRRRKQIA